MARHSLSIHLHLPFLYPFSFSALFSISLRRPLFPSLLSFIFSPHMWFCSSSLCTPSLPLLLFCHPSLTYGFSLWACVCLVLPRVHWGSLLILVCFADRDKETKCVCLQAYGFACLGLCVCVCVLGRVQQGSSRLCNIFNCGSFRGRLPPLTLHSFSLSFLPVRLFT